MGQNEPDTNSFGETHRKKIAHASEEEFALVIEGLDEIIGG
jgi:hypothetical protein